MLGHENINSPIYTQLDPNQCHVMTEFLNRYTLIGESVPGGRALKIYRLAAFAPAMPPSMDYSIRVYVVEDTIDALDVSYRIIIHISIQIRSIFHIVFIKSNTF